MRNENSDDIHRIVVIVVWKIILCKKIVKMIMKINVLKSGFKAKGPL